MTTSRQFSLAIEALAEIRSEVDPPSLRGQPVPAVPALTRVLAEIGSLPREALFLGIALDGLPVLLNLHDPVPGPILITSDAGVGKTAFLKMIARSIQHTHRTDQVQFGVITNHPDEWQDSSRTNHQVGIFPVYQNEAQDFLLSLGAWAHANKSKQVVLLLIDDLESVGKMDAEALQNLRWLLLRGTSHRVWPIVTMNAGRYSRVLAWIPMFRTRIFGRIEEGQIAAALGGDEAAALHRLKTGIQFTLRENGGWVRFWLPGP